jgi:LAS superfamily LD-carboxypeptidase LdcB
MLDRLQLTGRARGHILQRDEPRFAVHLDVLEPWLAMREAAAAEGIDLAIFSGFRDFQSQAEIWNRKYTGERTLFDETGAPIDDAGLPEDVRIQCILNWSALPGASRHHWGTDIDVFDRAAMPEGYRVRLLPEEYLAGGVFHRLANWLDGNIGRFGFFRPYAEYRGGMFAEPWHLSFAAVAVPALAALTPDLVAEAVEQSDILGKQAVLGRLPEIFERHVLNVAQP